MKRFSAMRGAPQHTETTLGRAVACACPLLCGMAAPVTLSHKGWCFLQRKCLSHTKHNCRLAQKFLDHRSAQILSDFHRLICSSRKHFNFSGTAGLGLHIPNTNTRGLKMQHKSSSAMATTVFHRDLQLY